MYERPHVNVKVELRFFVLDIFFSNYYNLQSVYFEFEYISLSLDRRPVISPLWPRETAVARSGAEQVRERVFGSFFSVTSPRENRAQF